MTIDPVIRRALRTIIFAQCMGVIGTILLNNGFMLTYLARLNIPGYRILFLLSLLPLVGMLLTLPTAYLADRLGKKRVGGIGLQLSIAGFALLPLAGFFPESAGLLATCGLLIFSIGTAINSSSWFALLSPIIPEEIRGRFFGRLRMTFQTFGILFSLGVALLLRFHPEMFLFQLVLLSATLLMAGRFFLYVKIPELEPEPAPRENLLQAIGHVLKIPHYLPFCSYVFLLSLFTGAIPWLSGLLQKEVLLFSDSQIVLMGNLTAAGMIAGFFAGGKLVDAFSTKPIFLTGHLALAGILLTLVLRDFVPLPPPAVIGLLSLLLGMVQGATGIATSSEMLALIPQENKSLSTGLNLTLLAAGISCGGLLSGQALKLQVLQPEWILFGNTLSAYDTLLLGSGVMMVLLSVTLGLVPSVIGIRSQWVPQNR